MGEEEIKKALRDCLQACQKAGRFKGPADLARQVNKSLAKLFEERQRGSDKKKQTISDQTASNWIRGAVIPDWDLLEALSDALDVPEDEILFGPKRGEQLRRERQYVIRATEEEIRLLTIFRETAAASQTLILEQARSVSKAHPAPEAAVHQLRRKGDKKPE